MNKGRMKKKKKRDEKVHGEKEDGKRRAGEGVNSRPGIREGRSPTPPSGIDSNATISLSGEFGQLHQVG